MIRLGLLTVLVVLAIVFVVQWLRTVAAGRTAVAGGRPHGAVPCVTHLAIGAVTNFFDTLGIGSFATTTTAYKVWRLVPDELIPGTMILGHALPVVAQALIFVAIVEVDTTLLLSVIAAMLAGGWLGAGIVTKLPRRRIQIGMGSALLLAATFMAMSQLGLFPGGGTAIGLAPGKLLIAVVVNFVLGALVMLGIGNYGPCLILFSLLGMDPRAAFPVMMSSASMVALIGGLRFMAAGRYDLRAALGLAYGGIPAVLVAGLLVKSMPIGVLRWMVVCVVIYAAFVMLRSSGGDRRVRRDANARQRTAT
jgi:uncharacterized membrane protein YfcA